MNKVNQAFSETNQCEPIQGTTSAETLLSKNQDVKLEDVTIRHDIRPGDAGYIIYMHGWIYKQEYNYTTAFEGYVAQSFYEFLTNYDADKDKLWLAEHNNEIVGCVGVVNRGDKAQLRWLLIHPDYRKIGLGKRLFYEAIEFCREKGYKTAYLLTSDDLKKAISIYTKVGFKRTPETGNYVWDKTLKELKFELNLDQ